MAPTSQRPRGARNAFRCIDILSVLLILLATIAPAVADDDDATPLPATDEKTAADQGELQSARMLPRQTLAGQQIRTLGIYRSQLDELIPDDFLPISIDRLIEGLSTLAPVANDDQRDRLNSAVYWIEVRDDVLVSRRSEINIESASPSSLRRSLGPVNFAVEPATNYVPADDSDNTPRLENESSGDLVAVFADGSEPVSKIQFKWQLRGKPVGSGYNFDVQLPRTAQTRVVLSVSPDIEISSLDGVLRTRSGPPPDADTFVSAEQKRWYELDAGGLNRIRLRTRPINPTAEGNPWIVRNNFLQYDADPTGLTWICRMLVQAADDGRIPILQFRNTTVTNINVNSFDVPFTSTIRGVLSEIQIDAPEGILENPQGLTTITIRGTSSTLPTSTVFELPMPYWLGNAKLATTVDQIQLLVSDDLQITRWELPDDWTVGSRVIIEDGSTMYAASGPPPSQSLPTNLAQTNLRPRRNSAWSRVRFSRPPSVNSSETALRLELNNGLLTAHARIAVKTNFDGLAPFRIAIEPEWNLDSIVYGHSSRVIEIPRMPKNGRVLTLWPEDTDVDGGEIVLELVGSHPIDSEASRLTIPATWFAAPHNQPSKLVAAILRPAELNWVRNALVNADQMSASELSESAKSFLGDLPSDALLFRPEFGRTPAVSLEQPIATFDAETQFHILRDRDELIENLEIEIESSGEPLQQIVVQTGPSADRPPYLWSLGDRENSPRIGLPKSAITVGTGKQDGIYTINLTDQSLRGQRLIGHRIYRADGQPKVHLPTVVGATSTRSFAWIASGWTLSEKPADIHTVFVDPKHQFSLDAPDSVSTHAELDSRDSIGLRYDQSKSPVITLSKSEQNKHVAIVRREQIRVVASSRGVDRIEATYFLAPSVLPMRIDYEPTLQLVSMSRNDSPVVLKATTQKFVTIPPRSEAETVRLAWNRDEYENHWLRTCRIPRITTSGIVLRSEYELIPASDAFAPAVLLHGLPSSDQRYSTIDLQSGDSVLLIRRNVVLATGWLVAMLVFAISWHLARVNPLILACACVVVVTAILLWWPWRLGLIGWLMVPMIAAGMLATARSFHSGSHPSNSVPPQPADVPDSNAGASPSGKQLDESSDFSVQTVFRLLPWLLLAVSFVDTTLVAQEPETENSQPIAPPIVAIKPKTTPETPFEQSVNVLVPVEKDGKQIGSTVYVHQSLQRQFTRPVNNATPLEVAYRSAHYRVHIDGSSTANRSADSGIVEAEFLIHLEDGQHNMNRVRLPFAASSVRRIELLGNRYQLIIADPDTPTSVIARLPRGDSFRIRVTLTANQTQSKSWNKISLSIPKVAASQLIVESDQDYDAIRLGGATGDILAPTDPRRWVELIGPIDQLQIEYPANRATAGESPAPLRRRYIVDAGLRNISIDCQIDTTADKTMGDYYQFIVLDDRVPTITSKHWKLEQTEYLESARRRITVRSNHDEPGPIHLLWSQPIESNHGPDFESYTIDVPEVVASGQTQTADAWIALRCDPTLQFEPLVGDDIESLSIDHFNAAWKGHIVGLDRAYVSVATIPSPVIQRKPRDNSTIIQQHHLHVTADRSLLSFKATLAPGDTEEAFHCLRFPNELQIQELLVNGVSRPFRPTRYPNHLEISLGDLRDLDSVEIQATAILPFDDRAQFSPPHISVFPARVTSDEYLVSREPWIAIHDLSDSPTDFSALPSQTAVAWLQNGWSPAMSWQINHQDSLQPAGLYQVETFPTDFNCQQLISIDRQDGDWIMEANVLFESDQVPDVIDVDLPTRWCDALQVEGALQWLQIDINDPERKIIRIRYDKQSVAKRSLTIRGRLQPSDTARLSVPSVLILGLGQRESYVDIPNRSPAGEPIQWQTNGVESAPLPTHWTENRSASAAADRSRFLVTAPAWSIELAPLPEIDVDPVAFLFDCNVFSQTDGALVHASWDLSPGTLDSVDLLLPEGATLLAAWSAARAVETQSLDSQQQPSTNRRIRIPLSVSRLPQELEVLLRIPSSAAKQGNYIPELIGIPVNRRWLAHYVPKYQKTKYALTKSALSFSNSSRQSQLVLGRQRHLDKALSIVESVESIDRVAGQSEQEIGMLLELWRLRYQVVRAQVQPELSTETIRAEWADIDLRLGQLFLGHGIELDTLSDPDSNTQSLSNLAMESLFGSFDISGFQVERITSLNANQSGHAVQPESSSDRGLKTLINHSLTLMLVIGILVCLIPLYRFAAPLTAHPAFWLASMGVFGFAIAPIGVAGAMVLLAIALPVFPVKRPVYDPSR